VSGPVGRVLGVDLGERRIGLAVTDPSCVLASPHDTLQRAGDRTDGVGTDDLKGRIRVCRKRSVALGFRTKGLESGLHGLTASLHLLC